MIISGIAGAQKRVAVMELVAKGVDENTASLLGEIVRARVYEAKDVFVLMNREDMVDILGEAKFQQSGACDSTSCAVEMGSALGLEKMIMGSVGKLGRDYSLTLKLVGVASGRNEILVNERHSGSAEGLPEFIQKATGKLVKRARKAALAEIREKASGDAEARLAEKRLTHSATRAAALGLVPGLGQLYNQQGRRSLYFAAAGALAVGGTVVSYLLTEGARDDYQSAGPGSDLDALSGAVDARRAVNQVFFFSIFAVVGVSAVDSYLGALSFRQGGSGGGEVAFAYEF